MIYNEVEAEYDRAEADWMELMWLDLELTAPVMDHDGFEYAFDHELDEIYRQQRERYELDQGQ